MQQQIASKAGNALNQTYHDLTRSRGNLSQNSATSGPNGDVELVLAENKVLRLQVEKLQARVDELEDMIEAEEQQSRI